MSTAPGTTLQSARSPNDSRILTLLGQGIPQSMVAVTVGVSESYISQLISQDDFREELQALKFHSLQKHNDRDAKYDSLEDKLVAQFESNMCMIQKPGELLRAIQVINGLKRRGSGAPEAVLQQQTVVNLLLPQKVVQEFTTNINGQVTNIGEQTLEAIQSSTLLNVVQNRRAAEIAQAQEVSSHPVIPQIANNPAGTLNDNSKTRSRSEELVAAIRARHQTNGSQ